MYSEFLFCPILFQLQNEGLVQVFSPMVGMENFDQHAQLLVAPCQVLFVRVESIRFHMEEVEVGQTSTIISVHDVIMFSTFASNRCRLLWNGTSFLYNQNLKRE